jgi:hypothetical protein
MPLGFQPFERGMRNHSQTSVIPPSASAQEVSLARDLHLESPSQDDWLPACRSAWYGFTVWIVPRVLLTHRIQPQRRGRGFGAAGLYVDASIHRP